MSTKLAPEHINHVAEFLLISNAFLAACSYYPFMKEVDFPPFPLTQDKVDIENAKVRFLELKELNLVNHGVLFGFLYVCFVWLRGADEELFERAIQDSDFKSEWTPFLRERLELPAGARPPGLAKMMRLFRNAIAHGNIYINIDEAINSGESPHLCLSYVGNNNVAGQFTMTFTDLVRFAEATHRAHTAATYNKRYREIGGVREIWRVASETIPTVRF